MKQLLLLVILFFMTTPLLAAKPQWCSSYRLNATEQIICDTPRLWETDHQVNEVYHQLRNVSSSSRKKTLQEEQKNWLQYRNSQCIVSVEQCWQVQKERVANLKARLLGVSGQIPAIVQPPVSQPVPQPAPFPQPVVQQQGMVVVCTRQHKRRILTVEYLVAGSKVPCQVIYEKPTEEPGYREILWTAQNEVGYCERKLDHFIRSQLVSEWGWQCSYDATTGVFTDPPAPISSTLPTLMAKKVSKVFGDPPYEGLKASSTLAPQCGGECTYYARNLADIDKTTAWTEGKRHYGIGEYVEFYKTVESSRTDCTWFIMNGYQKSYDSWSNNTRVKQLKLYVNTIPVAYIKLHDTMGWQSVVLNSLRSHNRRLKFRAEIAEIYPGSKWKDTTISEVRIACY